MENNNSNTTPSNENGKTRKDKIAEVAKTTGVFATILAALASAVAAGLTNKK